MASASITARTTRSGGKRYTVRYRLSGRAYPVQHAGSFPTMKEAGARRDLVDGELAAGRNPADLLGRLVDQSVARSFEQWAEAYRTSRVDLGEETRKNTSSHIFAM